MNPSFSFKVNESVVHRHLFGLNDLGNCNLILTYSRELNELDELEQQINDPGRVKVEVLKIKGDILFYNGF